MNLTLDDIARMAGVSRSTVSRVLNHGESVNEPTRRRVHQILEETHFQPNLTARRLAVGRNGVLGLVVPLDINSIFADPFFAMLTQSVSTACSQRGYSVMFWPVESSQGNYLAIQQALRSGLLDGIIIPALSGSERLIRSVAEIKKPYITIGNLSNGLTPVGVDVDNYNGARLAVTHLQQLGRKVVATIAGPQHILAGKERLMGYQDTIKSGQPDLIAEGDFSDNSGYLAMNRLMAKKPDAVFAANDLMAIGAMRALTEAGIKIPDDVAVIGFDDIPEAEHTRPPLTTIRQQVERIGTLAVDMLVTMVEHPTQLMYRITLPVELVVRASCGAIPKNR